ncbi:hypothetical protein FGO68_gene8355 [Halteria grandinella]|uniref:Uncharacterized protein n=1 Tax=Halteria grandinella TaxID=5974 RepID=A0A8J8T6Z7_HALGN|nr:hypothetical protein FGO68_gene8355 [Halteria grandinella]
MFHKLSSLRLCSWVIWHFKYFDTSPNFAYSITKFSLLFPLLADLSIQKFFMGTMFGCHAQGATIRYLLICASLIQSFYNITFFFFFLFAFFSIFAY